MKIFCIVAVLSLLATPLVFSEDGGEPSSPPPGGPAFDFDGDGQVDEPWFPIDRNQIGYQVVPNVRGLPRAWTCQAQTDSGSTEADEACEFGRELSRMEPCTRPEDCQALNQWNDRVGSPGMWKAVTYGTLEVLPQGTDRLEPQDLAVDEDEP